MINRYGTEKPEYWARQNEQESRMLERYLENKGITSKALGQKRKGEWGNEINPAFDKFFDKLRDMSKRGIALPAIAGLLGGGAALTAADEKKKKKSEVK
jgi:hypothetical protein